MMREHDRVVLTASVIQDRLEIGDVGTVVHVNADGSAFEVQFMTLDGQTKAVATVEASAIRPVSNRDISHSRHLQSS